MTYAFYFDSRFCSGCKACQAACKDKNDLPLGVLWRRVIEVSGGTWQQMGEAWNNTVFAYNLTLSCNHCVHPKCAGVCPVDAYDVRADGVVLLDTTRCIGCGYCSWACPYGAPQYNAEAGHMTKCNFCFDNLEQGLPPACVAACPLRVLGYGEMSTAQGLALWTVSAESHPYPLPTYSRTEPRLAITPHPAMGTTEIKSVANLEEIQPRSSSPWGEVPLMLYTLLAQMAVGGFWALPWMFPALWVLVDSDATSLRLLPSLVIGLCLGMAMLASLGHLGTKKNAWRVFGHLRKSWLSREILFTGLFGIGWLSTTFVTVSDPPSTLIWTMLTALFGLGLIHSMAQVYRLRAAPGWNTWRTNLGFMISAAVLGISAMAQLLAYESYLAGIQVPAGQWMVINGSILALLLIQLAIMPKRAYRDSIQTIRIGLIITGVALAGTSLLRAGLDVSSLSIMLTIIVVAEEILGRWLFYQSRLET